MSSGGSSVSVVKETVYDGYGENTMVWIPLGMNDAAVWPAPAGDTTYTVNIQNVVIGSMSRNFTYNVIVINP
jgi:hypothetical protein